MPVGFPDYYGGLTLPVTVQEGGTGQTSFPVGTIPIGQGTSGLLASNIGTANQVFQIDPTSLLPTWKDLTVSVSSITGILPIANGGTGTSTPNLTAGAGISISGTWPNQTITNSDDTYFTSGILQIAHGGTGTSTPALVAGAGISISGSWPNQTITNSDDAYFTSGILQVPHGGTGTSTPSLVAGAGISISGTWPNQTITNSDDTYFTSGILQIAHGGTGTSTPALVAGAGISISGTWPNQTITNSDDTYFTSGILQIAHGGTGTSTPALAAGSNIGITGTWPNQTIAVTNPPSFSGAELYRTVGLTGDVATARFVIYEGNYALNFLNDTANKSTVNSLTYSWNGNTLYNRAYIDQVGNLGLAGMITSYNQHTTAGGGVPAIVVQSTATGISTSRTLVSYTPPATGFYRISAYVMATASGTGSLNVLLTWRDPWTSSTQNINLIVSSGGLQSNSALSGSMIVYASSSANIILTVDLGSGGPTIDVGYMIEAL